MAGEIVGRERELTVVGAFLDRPVDRLRALVLEGEAGVGKSTLWSAGVAAARERSYHVLTSRPSEAERTLAHVVLGDLFADVEPDVLSALPGPRRRAFEAALLREEPDGPVDPRALGVAILTLLPMVGHGRPVVLAVDDDQWLDASSGATLRFALRRSRQQPVLLLLSRRMNSGQVTALEDAADPAEVGRLRVGPLSVGALQQLLHQRLGIALPRPTLLQVHEVSGGNPFYALELARAKSLDPALDAAVPLAVPASLERLLAARLEALDSRTRRALLFVAAHGRLPAELLRPLQVAPEALEQALAANLIESAEGVIHFTHPLLASAVYHGTAGQERRAAHRRLGSALDDPVDRARHLALAADEPDEDLAAALESAGRVARDRGMSTAAAELAEHSLRCTPPDPPDQWRGRALMTARAHMAAGELGRARAIADDLLARTPRGAGRAEALVLASELEDPRAAVALLSRALEEAAAVPALRAVIHARLANHGSFLHGGAWVERHAQASLRLAEWLNDDALGASALSTLARLRFDSGDPRGPEVAERAYRLALPLGDASLLKDAAEGVTHVLAWSGSNERAREWLEGQLKDWGDRDELLRAECFWYLTLVELWSGRWSIASECDDHRREISVQYGLELPQDHLPRALIALHRGEFAVARDHSQRALSLAKGQLLPAHLAILAVADLWSGSPAAALADFSRAEEAADARGWGEPNLRWWRAEHVEGLLQLGRIDEATGVVADWEAAAARVSREYVLAQTVRCHGLIAAAHGDLPASLRLLEEAVDLHAAVGDLFGRARAFLALGVVRRRVREKRTARAALEAALTGFEALGAMSWAATAQAELARIGGRVRIEGLSPSELRVAELVAEGHSNREIASALFLGERTVASHLTHVYAKLGVRSRTELARRVPPPAASSPADSTKVPTS